MNKNKIITLRFTVEELAKVHEVAEFRGLSISGLLRSLGILAYQTMLFEKASHGGQALVERLEDQRDSRIWRGASGMPELPHEQPGGVRTTAESKEKKSHRRRQNEK